MRPCTQDLLPPRCNFFYGFTMKKKPIRIVPYLCGCGAFSGGSEEGPLALARSGLVASLRRKGIDIDWWRDPLTAEYDYKALGLKARPAAASAAREDVVYFHVSRLCDDVESALNQGYRVVTIGGDHSMAIGSVAGLARARKAQGKTGLLWVDAHPDIHTMKTSRRKTFHAVPVSVLLGEGPKRFSELAGKKPALTARNIAFVGLRSIDEPEMHHIVAHNIKTFTNGDLDQFGLASALRDSIAHIKKGAKAGFLSIDLDGRLISTWLKSPNTGRVPTRTARQASWCRKLSRRCTPEPSELIADFPHRQDDNLVAVFDLARQLDLVALACQPQDGRICRYIP
jgi:arginase